MQRTKENGAGDSQQADGYKIKTPEIRSIEGPMLDLAGRLKPNLEDGKYDLLIGDDLSGRIPSLILYNVAKGVYSRNGQTPPRIVLMAANNRKLPEGLNNLDDYEEWWKKTKRPDRKPHKKVLIVTESLSSGIKMHNLRTMIPGIPFDVAALYKRSTELEYKLSGHVGWGTKVFTPNPQAEQFMLYGKYHILGFPEEYRKDVEEKYGKQPRSTIPRTEAIRLGKQTIEDINLMSNKILLDIYRIDNTSAEPNGQPPSNS